MNYVWPPLRVTEFWKLTKFMNKVTQYDRETGDGSLFVEKINTFLKLKAEASGYP
jgi:hypothetical protein